MGDNDLNVPDANGHFPIATAIRNDDVEVLSLIISNGGNVNIDLGQGWTPLHEVFDYAIDSMIQQNREKPFPETMRILRVLLDNGADLKLKNINGKTPLDSLNTYAANINGFNSLKDSFREVLPEIDNMIQFDQNNPIISKG